MKGHIIAINPKKGFIAVQIDSGITVMELLGGYEVELEDIISGALENHGGETVRNVTQGEDMNVYIQGVYCTPSSARALIA